MWTRRAPVLVGLGIVLCLLGGGTCQPEHGGADGGGSPSSDGGGRDISSGTDTLADVWVPDHTAQDRALADAATPDTAGLDGARPDAARPDTSSPVDAGRTDSGGVDAAPRDAGGSTASREAYVAALCEFQLRCRVENGSPYASEQACAEYLNDLIDCGFRYSVGSFTYGVSYEYDEQNGATCAQWMEQASCDQATEDGPDACENTLRARIISDVQVEYVGEGQLCDSTLLLYYGNADMVRLCEVGLYCESGDAEGDCSVCVPALVVGEDCYGSSIPCAAGSYCDDSTQRCQAEKILGMGCAEDRECRSSFCHDSHCAEPIARDQACSATDRCRGVLTCRGGVCTDPLYAGDLCTAEDACAFPSVCQSGTCAAVDFCTPGQIGDPCIGYCVEGATCDTDVATCVAQVPVGQACQDYYDCVSGAYCDSGTSTCVAYAAIGANCTYPALCNPFEGYCDYVNSVCVAYKAAGDECASSYECTPYWCDPDSSTCSDQCTMP